MGCSDPNTVWEEYILDFGAKLGHNLWSAYSDWINENGANSADNNLPIQNMIKAISLQIPDFMNKSQHVICYVYA